MKTENYKVGDLVKQYQGFGNGWKLGKITKMSEKSIWVQWPRLHIQFSTTMNNVKQSLQLYNGMYKDCDIRFVAVTDWWLRIPYKKNKSLISFEGLSEPIRIKKNPGSNPSIVSEKEATYEEYFYCD
jgi:hypothetical protein